jgi:hypothetical protein
MPNLIPGRIPGQRRSRQSTARSLYDHPPYEPLNHERMVRARGVRHPTERHLPCPLSRGSSKKSGREPSSSPHQVIRQGRLRSFVTHSLHRRRAVPGAARRGLDRSASPFPAPGCSRWLRARSAWPTPPGQDRRLHHIGLRPPSEPENRENEDRHDGDDGPGFSSGADRRQGQRKGTGGASRRLHQLHPPASVGGVTYQELQLPPSCSWRPIFSPYGTGITLL